MEELILVDEDFATYNELLTKINVAIETKLSAIIEQLQVASTGVSEGDFHDNLVTYVSKLIIMQGQLSYFTGGIQGCANKFVADVVLADMFDN